MPRQFQSQETTTAAQTGHHGAEQDVQHLGRFAIRESLDIDEQE